MTATPQPLTKIVGKTERTLQALLNAQLQSAALSFPEWTILVFLSNGALTTAALLSAIEEGQIARGEKALALLGAVEARGLVRVSDSRVELTDEGSSLFVPLRSAVRSLTVSLVAGIPEADLETTNRTLAIVAARAEDLLAANAP